MACSRSALVVTTGLISHRAMRLALSRVIRSSGLTQARVTESRVRDSGMTRCCRANSSEISFSNPSPLRGLSSPEALVAKGMPSCLPRACATSSSVVSPSSTRTSPMSLFVPRCTSSALASCSCDTSPPRTRISPILSFVLTIAMSHARLFQLVQRFLDGLLARARRLLLPHPQWALSGRRQLGLAGLIQDLRRHEHDQLGGAAVHFYVLERLPEERNA